MDAATTIQFEYGISTTPILKASVNAILFVYFDDYTERDKTHKCIENDNFIHIPLI